MMTGIFGIFRILKWIILAGVALGIISLVLVYFPDENLNALGEGLSALAGVLSDLPNMLLNFILLLVALILMIVVVKFTSRD